MRRPLNFAKVPFRNERLPRLLYGLVVLLLLGTTVTHGVVLTRYLLREREELDVKVEALQEELAAREEELRRSEDELRAERSEAFNERIRFLTATYREKGFSWTGLFNELETLTPNAVRITSIVPSEEKGEIQVRLNVVGRTLADVLQMVGQLEANHLFGTVLPLDETQGSAAEGEGLTATLILQYLPHLAEPQAVTTAVPPSTGIEAEQADEPTGDTSAEQGKVGR